jgi:hypothetical protein
MADNRYKNAKVYRLVNTVDDEIYVGSTCSPLPKRLYEHKQKANLYPNRRVYQHFDTIGFENVKIVLIEEYPCNNKMELERRERHWIEETKAGLNKILPTQTKKEYREKNKEVITIAKKLYYQNNKEVIGEKTKQYIEINKEVVAQKKKEYYDKNKEVAANRMKQYREKNKEVLDRKKKEWWNENKEVINAKRREARALKKQQS